MRICYTGKGSLNELCPRLYVQNAIINLFLQGIRDILLSNLEATTY